MALTRKQLLARINKQKHLGTFKGFEHQKQLSIKAVSAVEVTPDVLATINKFSIAALTAEEIFVSKYLMAHNCVDRDRERFPDDLLVEFAATFPGKSFLIGHSRGGPGKGLFFQASTEDMTVEQFKALTGEDARLPDGTTTVRVLWTWQYMLNNQYNEETILNTKAGIYRHVSIGFKASDLIAVKGQFDQILYYEYVGPGEALEGSLVWLGAQPGATAQKAVGEDDDLPEDIGGDDINDGTKTKGGSEMDLKTFLALCKKIFKGKSFTEDSFEDDMKFALGEYVAAEVKTATTPLEAKIAELTPLAAKAAELAPLAEEGKAYRSSLCELYAGQKQKIGDIDDKPESLVKAKEIATGFSLEFLKAEIAVLGKRVEEKFPAGSELGGGDDAGEKRDQGGKKKNALGFDKEEK